MNHGWWLKEYYLKCKRQSCEFRRILNVKVLLRIEISQLRWFGHVSRMPNKRLARQVLLVKPTAKRPKGRPRPRWSHYLSDLALVWSQQNYQRLLLIVRCSKRSYSCCPNDPPWRKNGHETGWNEQHQCHLFYSSVFKSAHLASDEISYVLELINTNVESPGNDLHTINDTFGRK